MTGAKRVSLTCEVLFSRLWYLWHSGWSGLNCIRGATWELKCPLGDHDLDKVGTSIFSGWLLVEVTMQHFLRTCSKGERIGWIPAKGLGIDLPLGASYFGLFTFSNITRCVASFTVRGCFPRTKMWNNKTSVVQVYTRLVTCRAQGKDFWVTVEVLADQSGSE